MRIHSNDPINPFSSLRKESRLKMAKKTHKEYIFNVLITVICFNMSDTELVIYYNCKVTHC
jgi:hypothetical protein